VLNLGGKIKTFLQAYQVFTSCIIKELTENFYHCINYFRSFENEKTSVCPMERSKLNNKADQKFLTENPSTSSLHNIMMMALMTKRNSPNVKMVTGKVNKIKMGFTKKLSKPKTIATIMAVANPSTATPPRKLANKVTNIAVTNNLIIKYIIKDLQNYCFI